MRADIYWIPATRRLAVMPRPRAGDWLEDEIKSLRVAGVDVIVSLLTPGEVAELGLTDEPAACRANQIEYSSFPIPDRQVPTNPTAAVALAHDICRWLEAGKGVAIHCRAGIGRSALIAACVMVSQGFGVAEVFEVVSKARGAAVPDTEEQRNWVANVASELRRI
jgi:protein-tyrosine phosphatase